MPERRRPRVQTYCLRNLEQARILADPLRIRVLQAFSREPKTTKQVAGLLGEKPTRLYHHVQALETVGLIELVETRPVRGTVEKYFQAVATRFEVDSSLFFPTAEDASEMGDMIASILDRTRAGLLSCADRLGEAVDEGPTPPSTYSVILRLSPDLQTLAVAAKKC